MVGTLNTYQPEYNCWLQGQIPGGVSRVGDGADQSDLEVAEYYWFPMLAGLSDLTSDPRTEVRNCALEVLFDLLKERGQNFSGPFWESVFHRVLFPIFDYVRHAGKDGEKPASADQWLRETCIHSLQLLCDLFSSFYKVCPLVNCSSYNVTLSLEGGYRELLLDGLTPS